MHNVGHERHLPAAGPEMPALNRSQIAAEALEHLLVTEDKEVERDCIGCAGIFKIDKPPDGLIVFRYLERLAAHLPRFFRRQDRLSIL